MDDERLTQLVKMLDGMSDEERTDLIRNLARQNPMLALRLHQRHFGFGDLRYANDAGIDALMESIDSDTLLEALHGADDVVVRRFVNQMGAEQGRKFLGVLSAMATPGERSRKAARKAVIIKAYILRDRGALEVDIPGMKSDFV